MIIIPRKGTEWWDFNRPIFLNAQLEVLMSQVYLPRVNTVIKDMYKLITVNSEASLHLKLMQLIANTASSIV